jgi:hypothetical protein
MAGPGSHLIHGTELKSSMAQHAQCFPYCAQELISEAEAEPLAVRRQKPATSASAAAP